jgi:hypothetical protein
MSNNEKELKSAVGPIPASMCHTQLRRAFKNTPLRNVHVGDNTSSNGAFHLLIAISNARHRPFSVGGIDLLSLRILTSCWENGPIFSVREPLLKAL